MINFVKPATILSSSEFERIAWTIFHYSLISSGCTYLILNTPPCTTLSRHYDLLSNTGRHSIASAPRYDRVCSQMRTNQLPDTTASAPRGGRACSQRRSCLLPEATWNHRTDFKDDDAFCIMLLNIIREHSYKTIFCFTQAATHQQKQSLFR